MNGGASLFALFFLLVVNLSEVDSIVLRPGIGQPRRSVAFHEVRAKRHATAMDSIIAPPEKVRLARAAAKLNEGKGRPGRSVGFNSRFVRDFNDFMKTIAKVRPGRSVGFNSRFVRGDDSIFSIVIV
ncbi:unnamed protein product [Meloidogyne enterolobii]|uniref:Uncharacterized protein n=1 Tax=Meloidogyne enterolobii TaxID=390850 RepID=A0ACB1AB15_MELEN